MSEINLKSLGTITKVCEAKVLILHHKTQSCDLFDSAVSSKSF